MFRKIIILQQTQQTRKIARKFKDKIYDISKLYKTRRLLN